MATTKKKTTDEGFLTTAAQAIGTTLGQLAKKAGVAPTPVKAGPKKAVRKAVAVKKKTAVKKKAAPKKAK